MVKSKAWNWETVQGKDSEFWKKPSLESYYLVERWKSQGKEEFLDLGCGLGRHSILFAENGFNVSACDLSETAVERTKRWAESLHLPVHCRVVDMLSLPYGDGNFGCILCRNVISHTDTEGVKKAFAEIKRVLKPDGECYFTLCSKNAWGYGQNWPVIDSNTKIRVEDGPENGVPHFFADYGVIQSLCAGMKIVSAHHINDILTEGVPGGGHYHVLVRKPAGMGLNGANKRK